MIGCHAKASWEILFNVCGFFSIASWLYLWIWWVQGDENSTTKENWGGIECKLSKKENTRSEIWWGKATAFWKGS